MSSEKADEFLSWRGRLGTPEGVPGQGLDHAEQTWERLVERFREKPRRRVPVYGIAAACLLVAVLTVSLFFRDRARLTHSDIVQQTTPLVAHTDTSLVGRPNSTVWKQDDGSVSRPAELRVSNQDDGSAKGTRRGRLRASDRIVMRTASLTDDTVRTPEAPVIPLVSQLPMARPVLQKARKVVDLNELYNGQPAAQRMASNRSVLPLHFGFGKADPPAGPPGGSPVPADPGINLKLVTSN